MSLQSNHGGESIAEMFQDAMVSSGHALNAYLKVPQQDVSLIAIGLMRSTTVTSGGRLVRTKRKRRFGFRQAAFRSHPIYACRCYPSISWGWC